MNNLGQLIHTIKKTHSLLQKSAVNAVNVTLTIRNWLVGFYIIEYEQNGQDRADYGAELLKEIASKIKIKGLTAPELSRCRQFYKTYPQILGTLSQDFRNLLPDAILATLSQKSLSPENPKRVDIPPEKIISRLSFSHIVELIKIENDTKRSFYELQAIKGVWSVRELRRQINSLFYERSRLSKKPEKLVTVEQKKIAPQKPTDIIKNIYAFDFLDLPVKEIVEESDLEKALLDNLQQFVQKYLLRLPDIEQLKQYIEQEIKEL